MIEIENDILYDWRIGDTVAYSPPVRLEAKTQEQLDQELREFLLYMSGNGPFPKSMEIPRIMVTLTKKADSLDEIKNADYYVKVKGGYLYRTTV